MQVDDITVEVRSVALGRLGEVDKSYLMDMKIIKRFKGVGMWSFSLPVEYDIAQMLAQPGRGILVTGPNDRILISGGLLTATHKETVSDPQGTWFFVGTDDMIHLADALAWPEPSNANATTQAAAHDVRTGTCEAVMRAYVSDNIGPSATLARRVDEITLAPNLDRGAVVTGRARFPVLGKLLSDLALAGGLGFDLVQVGSNLEFQVYEPSDKSQEIRMDIDNDMVDSAEYGFGAPTVTRAIVAGQGEGVDRRIIEVTNATAEAAESSWRRRIELFKDRRDTSLDTDLQQEGADQLSVGGDTITSLSVVPSDEVTMVYGVDWFLGDIVGVVVDDQELSAVVTEAIITLGRDGVRVAATIGDPVGFDYESRMIAKQIRQDDRIAFLEKNAEFNTNILPAGLIMAWASATAPAKWLICDGAAVSRTTYAALFAAISTTFGTGDGSTTFNVPNLNGRVIVGLDTGQTEFDVRGETGGAKTHTLTTAEMPSHTHTQDAHSHGQVVTANSGPSLRKDFQADGGGGTYDQGVQTFGTTATNQNTGGGGAHNNLQPYMALNYIIKV